MSIFVYMTKITLENLEKLKTYFGLSRSGVIRQLVEDAIKAIEKK